MHTSNISHPRARGFSLVELLVVIGIISLMASLVGVALSSNNGANSVKASQRVLAGLVQSARTQALLKQESVRILIHADENDPSRYRRFAGLVYFDSDQQGWVAVNDGSLLPNGAYFAIDSINSTFTSDSTIAIEYPRRTAQQIGSGDTYYYVEFNPNGTVVTPPAPIIAVQSARLDGPASPGNVPLIDDDQTMAAIAIHKLGTVSFLDDAEIIRQQDL